MYSIITALLIIKKRKEKNLFFCCIQINTRELDILILQNKVEKFCPLHSVYFLLNYSVRRVAYGFDYPVNIDSLKLTNI
ncbi:hypothetical protein GCM10022423_03450 [Flavobacterium ginsengiterrae]|uniref:Uncharacterized protein n=1 Tax=Flavobacterium ginsengiterrae TaxID=871695 RepID=A0ABP7G6P0_9FLAO